MQVREDQVNFFDWTTLCVLAKTPNCPVEKTAVFPDKYFRGRAILALILRHDVNWFLNIQVVVVLCYLHHICDSFFV